MVKASDSQVGRSDVRCSLLCSDIHVRFIQTTFLQNITRKKVLSISFISFEECRNSKSYISFINKQ